MTESVIKNHWMTIGTNHKEIDAVSESGRIRSGAKGIGRFALDKLGEKCILKTRSKKSSEGYIWTVNWQDFEAEDSAVIDQISANLEKTAININKIANDLIKPARKKPENLDFKTGTIISISELREEWKKFELDKLYKSLSTLIPPKEQRNFEIWLLSSRYIDEYGEIDSSPCDDFDYKIAAHIDGESKVTIEISRNEIDLKKLNPQIFDRQGMSAFPYNKKTFLSRAFKIERAISELVPGFKESDAADLLSKIGEFSFTFYFMKKTMTSDDQKRFFYKDFDSSIRNKWLDQHGGIKIFRDGFRVRPYGEPGNAADWLNLGPRQAASPAGIAKIDGGFRVREHNIAGVVEISRINNPEFKDKSSREGIQESKVFSLFKEVLIGIIAVFEKDRSYIARELDALHNDLYPAGKNAVAADSIKQRRAAEKTSDKENTTRDHDIDTLVERVERLEEEKEELLDEQRVLRILASNGTMLSVFIHELHGIKHHLISRTKTLKKLIRPYIPDKILADVAEENNPYIFIADMEESDGKLVHWMQFALGMIKKDKRTRKKINLNKYLKTFVGAWEEHLDSKQTTIKLSCRSDDISLRAFEVDFDTILNNLIINSIDAFQRKGAPEKRHIDLMLEERNKTIFITYKDSGPGLSKDIKSEDQIFDLFFTTKRDPNTAEQVGSGIGMWLIKKSVEEYNGEISIPAGKPGFQLRISIPNSSK